MFKTSTASTHELPTLEGIRCALFDGLKTRDKANEGYSSKLVKTFFKSLNRSIDWSTRESLINLKYQISNRYQLIV